MIARIWRGYTTHANAEAYAAALQAEILSGIMKVPGYRGSYLLKRLYGEEVEFVTMMLWESLESLSAFAGPDYEKAIVPLERRKFLSKYEERSAHYEILMQRAAADAPSGASGGEPSAPLSCHGATASLTADIALRKGQRV